MTAFRKVTDSFAVSPQISAADVAAAAADGVTLVINNRPDGEDPGQPDGAAIESAARQAGLDYVHIPIVGRPTPAQVEAMSTAISTASGKVLAYCRSGTRSISVWALGSDQPRETVLGLGRAAGYDLSGLLPVIPYVRDIAFEYGRVDQVSPLIRRVIANNPGPFTYTGTGTYIVGQGEVAVIDPGPDMADHLAAILAATSGERISHILVTHHHSDHSPLSRPLAAQSGATIFGRAVSVAPSEAEIRLEAGYDSFTPDVTVDTGDMVSGPGWTIEALHTPGHTSNHTCFALKEEDALFSGDHIMGWSTTVITPPDGDMGDYLASLDKVRELEFSTLWPTHGAPVTDPGPFIDAYKAHRLDRERQILTRLAAGDETIKDMVPVIYAAVDPRLYGAAAHSVLAHMIALVRSGRIESDGPPGLQSRYRLAGS